MRRTQRSLVLALVALGIVGFAAWHFWPASKLPAAEPDLVGKVQRLDDRQMQSLDRPAQPALTPAPASAPASMPASQPQAASRPAITDAGAARSAYQRGMELLHKSDVIEARSLLSEALLSGLLDPQAEQEAVKELTELTRLTLLCRGCYTDDPYTFYYKFQPGEVLVRLERKLELHVPTQLVLKVNGIADASRIGAGQTIKMVRGPIHAVVSKSRFTMDLFLQRDNLPRVFIARLKVGLGKEGSTPLGLWRVGLGKKMTHANWNPPVSATQTGSILWGQPGYPLGSEGYWIGLEGLDASTQNLSGYGIHGTNEPQTIGSESSLGCIRLDDEGIATVFTMLYEFWSTVEVRK